MSKKIAITTDSGLLKESEIARIIPSVAINGLNQTEKRDQVEITNKEIYEFRAKGAKFTTSAPSLGDYFDTFEKLLQNNDDIIHLSMSSAVSSASLGNSIIGKNEICPERIHVIDSKQGGPGGELLARKIFEYINAGLTVQEIIEIVENKIIPNILTEFFVPNPKGFLESGKGVSHTLKLIAVPGLVKLGVSFGISLDDGVLHETSKMHYRKEKRYLLFIQKILKNLEQFNPELIVYGGTLIPDEKLEPVKNHLESLNYFQEVIRSDMGAAISSYACEDTFGLSLLKK